MIFVGSSGNNQARSESEARRVVTCGPIAYRPAWRLPGVTLWVARSLASLPHNLAWLLANDRETIIPLTSVAPAENADRLASKRTAEVPQCADAQCRQGLSQHPALRWDRKRKAGAAPAASAGEQSKKGARRVACFKGYDALPGRDDQRPAIPPHSFILMQAPFVLPQRAGREAYPTNTRSGRLVGRCGRNWPGR